MKKRFRLIFAVFLITSMVFGTGLTYKHVFAADTKTAAADTKTAAADTKTAAADTKTAAADTKTAAADTKTVAADTKTADTLSQQAQDESQEQEKVPEKNVKNDTEPSPTKSSSNETALQSQTIKATIYTSSTYKEKQSGDKTNITLKGSLPIKAVVKAYPAKLENDTFENKNILAAYDITIFDAQGKEFEPDSAHPIDVTIDSNSIKEEKNKSHLNIYHMDNAKAKPETVKVKSVDADQVVFEAKKFSIYVVANDATSQDEGVSLNIDKYVALEPNGTTTLKVKLVSDYRNYPNITDASISIGGNPSGITVTPSAIKNGEGTITITAGENTGNTSFTVSASYTINNKYYSYPISDGPITVNVNILPRVQKDSDPTQQGSISHTKTAIKTNDHTTDGDPIYNLNLSFTGTKKNFVEKQRVDVVFIVDTSGSMSKATNKKEDRIDAAKKAIETFEDVAGPDHLNIDARYALVNFNGYNGYNDSAYNDAKVLQGWSKSIKTSSLHATYGGTNYEAGILAANNLLKNDNTSATKLVIFLTDGEPTFYYDTNGMTDGTPGKFDITALRHAETAISQLKLGSNDYFYAIGCGTANEGNLNSLSNAAKSLGCNTGVFMRAEAKDLSDAFKKIAAGTSTVDIKNVTIKDELSSNVTLIDKNKIKVKSGGADDSDATSDDTKNWTIGVNGKTVTATLNSNAEIDPAKKYVLVIPVSASEAAKENFVKNGVYPNQADANTGTYAGQTGYYSNEDATVTYIDSENKEGKLSYPKPVIRVYRMKIQKTFSGIDLSAKLKEEARNMTFSIKGPNNTSLIKDFKDFPDNSMTFSVPDTGEYTVNEVVKDIPGYHLTQEPTAQTVNVSDDSSSGSASVLFDNKYQRHFKVIKQDYNTKKKLSLSVKFFENDKNTQTVITSTTDDKYVDLDPGTYKVTESKLAKYQNSIGDNLQLTVGTDGAVKLTGANQYANFADDTLTLKNRQLMKVVVKKFVAGNMGNTGKEFNFNYVVKRDGKEFKKGTFTLKHNGEFTIGYADDYTGDLQYGDVVEITETDGNKDGYSTSYTIDDSSSKFGITATIDSVNKDGEIDFTNTRRAVAPTSMVTYSIPYVIAVAFGLGLLLVLRRINLRNNK